MAALGAANVALATTADPKISTVILPSGMEESRRAVDSGATVKHQDASSAVLDIFSAEDIAASTFEMEPVIDFADEKTYDIVVVGAGVAGVPVVLTALEEGATVTCLQKLSVGSATGSGESGIVMEGAGDASIANWLVMYSETCSYHKCKKLFREVLPQGPLPKS